MKFLAPKLHNAVLLVKRAVQMLKYQLVVGKISTKILAVPSLQIASSTDVSQPQHVVLPQTVLKLYALIMAPPVIQQQLTQDARKTTDVLLLHLI